MAIISEMSKPTADIIKRINAELSFVSSTADCTDKFPKRLKEAIATITEKAIAMIRDITAFLF
ncbi:hypothetical protein DSBG_2302 [Desulfosporosinus sp. BG]|nr:hypothetical protein DSBG_2302 [Desulfosporosinus sp. BG]